MPLLGETPEVKGLWSAAAVWVKEGPGVGKSVAEWMVHGESGDRPALLRHRPLLRAPEDARARPGARRRGLQQDLRHRPPGASSGRRTATCGCRRSTPARSSSAPSSSRPPAGSGRSGTSRTRRSLEEYGDRVNRREAEWDCALVVADHQRRAPGDARPRRHVRPDRVRDLRRRRPGRARRGADAWRCGRWTSPSAASSTRRCSRPAGGFKADLTIMRLGDELFRVVTGGAHGHGRPQVVLATTCPATAAPQLDRPHLGAGTTLGLWGPRARDILAARDPRRRLPRGLPLRAPAARSRSDTLRVLASRISYVGDLGWELYVPIEQGARLWDMVCEAGPPARRSSRPASASTARPAGSRSATAPSASSSRASTTSSRPAWPGARSRSEDFVGKEAHLRQRDAEPGRDPVHADGRRPHVEQRREALHARPRADPDAATARRSSTRRAARSYVTSAGAGPSIGKHILMAYLPPEQAVDGRASSLVEYLGERYPVTVAVAGSTPLFDPENTRIRVREDPRLREAGADDRRPDRARPPTSRRSRRATSASRSARTRSAASRRPCASSRQHGGESVVLTLGPAEAEEQLRDCMALGADRGDPLVTDERGVGRAGDRARRSSRRCAAERTAPFDLIVFGNESADAGNYQVGIRVAHALGRPCVTGLKGLAVEDGRVRCEQEVAGGPRRLRRAAAGGRDRHEGLNLPRYPSVPGRCARSASRSRRARPTRPAPKLEKLRLVVPRGPGQAGRGPRPRARRRRPAVVEILQPAGGRMSVLVLVEHDGGGPDEVSLRRSRSPAATPRRLAPGLRRSAPSGALQALGALGVARRTSPCTTAAATRPRPGRERSRRAAGGRRRRSSPPAASAATRCSRTSRRDSTSRSPRTASRSSGDVGHAPALGRQPARGGAPARRAAMLLTVAPHVAGAPPRPGAGRDARSAGADDGVAARASSASRPRPAAASRSPTRRSSSAAAAASARPRASRPSRSSPACSAARSAARASVTIAGWRPHTDQVGQTGTKIAPDLYIAVRDQRRDAAHRRLQGREEDPRDQHRPGGADPRERRLRRDRRPARGRAGDHAPSCERRGAA